VESNDIDIATDNCMGEEFAQAVKAYITSTSVTASDECGSSNEYTTGSIGVISANPEQSKHLETATMKVYGQEIDFVNLRSEEYSDSTSRIPTVQFGTPEQDAYRRDFTVNSLFYNIMTESVEDYTQMGLSDMSEGVIRTPLPAVTTFHDDPLRLLRAVRFATRYNFLLDHDIQTVGQMPEIHEALQCKISKERVYKELCGCFTGKLARPLAAIELIHEMKFFHVIFAPPSSEVLVKLHATVNTDTTVPLTCDTRGSEGKGDTKTVSSVMETWEVSLLAYVFIFISKWFKMFFTKT
jgi:tRNA nucleotidyltransferase (CCA-adding enzyme)